MLLQDSAANLSDSHRSSRGALLVCLLLAAVCYANSITNAFILDDVLIVAANERIRSISPIQFLFQPYWSDHQPAGNYRPLTIFSYSIEYAIWQGWPSGFRLTNLLLHALNGWLVFLVALGLLGSSLAAMAAAAVYVVHPLQTEAVVSIVGRSELLAAAFFFTALLAFRKGRTGWAAAAYLCAVLGKESAITLPAVVALDMALREGSFRKVMDSWRRFIPLAAAGAAYLGLRFYVLGSLGVPATWQYLQGILTLGQRWLLSGRVFLQYFRLLLAPIEVAGDYDFNSIPVPAARDWDAWFGLLIVAGCIFIALWNVKKRRELSFGILFFFLALLPVSNWIIPIALPMAERFLYIPVFGFALLAGRYWSAIPEKQIRRLVAAGVLGISILLCISHNYIWQDTLTFHTNVVRLLPNNARARLGYGYALLKIGHVADARHQFEEGLRILPQSAPLLAGLASTIMTTDGQCSRVRPVLAQAFKAAPGQWQALWILGDCFLMEGRRDLAEKSYGLAVQNAPFPDAKLLLSWGRALEDLGNPSAAEAAYQRAARIDPALFKNGKPTRILRYDQSADTRARPDPAPSFGPHSEH